MTGWWTDRWIYSMTDETASSELELARTEGQKGLTIQSANQSCMDLHAESRKQKTEYTQRKEEIILLLINTGPNILFVLPSGISEQCI